jgi:urease accessory protein
LTPPGWPAQLALRYWADAGHTRAHDAHQGPLRVLQALYPEGPAICHHVVVHPPGGVVGGDSLALHARLESGSHALLTNPGATRFYRSEGAPAVQTLRFEVAAGARLEWLPMETLAYRGCQAHNRLRLDLAPGAQALGWDVLALGLPAAGAPFDSGVFQQRIELAGQWLEQGRLDAADRVLMQSPLGLGGRSVLATAWCCEGQALARPKREALLDAARAVIDSHAAPAAHDVFAGATAPAPAVVVVRALAPRVEPVMQLLQAVRAAWRQQLWQLPAAPPRIWRT